MTDLQRTIDRISKELNNSLRPEFKKVWVQYSKSGGRIRMCLTVFAKEAFQYPNAVQCSYRQEFIVFKNFRNYKIEENAAQQVKQDQIFANQLNEIKNSVMNDYIQ